MYLAALIFALFAMSTPTRNSPADLSQTDTKEEIRILPVKATPESDTVSVVIAVPKARQLLSGNPVWAQIRVDGYPLGTDSQFDRGDELVGTKLGQTLHIIIDNEPYFPINGPSLAPFNEDGFYYDSSYKFEIPYSLSPGMHTLRVFPARSYGESLKGERSFHAIAFYVGEEKSNSALALNRPYLTYNEPSNQFYFVQNKPILLDFYITNCALTPDGYKVRLTIDGKIERLLTAWQPYYLYGLPKGSHTIRLELLDQNNERLPGAFNDTTRTITVH